MALFNFFSSKSSNQAEPQTQASTQLGGSIVVMDFDALISKINHWDFVERLSFSEIWLFTNASFHEQISSLQQKYVVKLFSLPKDPRQSPFYMLGVSLFEALVNKVSKLYWVSTLPYFEELTVFLNQKGINVECILLEPEKTSLLPKTTSIQPSNPTSKPSKKEQIKVKSIDAELIAKICQGFRDHFELEGIYEKKALGELVKITTGKNVQKVFHTQNAKLYVGCLYQSECIQNLNEQDFKLLKYPTPDIFPSEVRVIKHKRRK